MVESVRRKLLPKQIYRLTDGCGLIEIIRKIPPGCVENSRAQWWVVRDLSNDKVIWCTSKIISKKHINAMEILALAAEAKPIRVG